MTGWFDSGKARVLIDCTLPQVQLRKGFCSAPVGVKFPTLVQLHGEFVVYDKFVQHFIPVVVARLKMSCLLHRFLNAVTKGRIIQRFASLHRQQQIIDIADVAFRENTTSEEVGFCVKLPLGFRF